MEPCRRFRVILGSVLAAGLLARIAYVAAQPGTDPAYSRPILDGAYYLEWARALASGGGFDGSAYYMAPLYPFVLSVFLRLFGESFGLLYVVQHLAIVGGAWALAIAARRAAGDGAAIATAVLALAYHPLLFFASRPLGEPLPLLLLACGVAASTLAAGREDRPDASGLLVGLASLGRPNLLAVALFWSAALAARRRWRQAVWVLAGAAAAIAPATVRNLAASGHLVPVSANSGIVAYLGNAPGAVGVLTPLQGFSGDVMTQRREAVALARARSGKPLDPVEADRYWGTEALRARASDPAGTLVLLGRRILLMLDDDETGLDYPPRLDGNPLRWTAPVAFAVLLGLAGAGVALCGLRGTGGASLWLAFAATALTPVLFYATSRHRLPMAMLLAIPAGAGLAAIVEEARERRWGSRLASAVVAGLALAGISLSVPSAELNRTDEATWWSNLADVLKREGDLAGAESLARRAAERDGGSAAARYNLGVILEAAERAAEAEAAYREALARDPGLAEAAANLAGILVRRGSAAEAVPLLRRAIESRPGDAVCRTNLVVALAASGDAEGARRAAREAGEAGIALDEGLLRSIGGTER